MEGFGTLSEVDLHEVWPDEARDFTPWLADNPAQLGETLQMDLELEQTEFPVGPFFADVVLRDTGTDQRVVVENMLGRTDHDHLGKLITYAAGLEAHWAVLIAERIRPEHRSALNWLNSISDEGSGFFGIEVRVYRIGDSKPAVSLGVVAMPDDFSRTARHAPKQVTEVGARYAEWWSEFIPVFREAHPGWTNAYLNKAHPHNWIRLPSGRSDVRYGLFFSNPTGALNYRLVAEVLVPNGEMLFPQLLEMREAIEGSCDLDLVWDPIEGKQASRVAVYLDPADPAQRHRWPEYSQWAVDTLGKLRDAFTEPIKSLP